jgi:sec-independent protein translocase protein TatC
MSAQEDSPATMNGSPDDSSHKRRLPRSRRAINPEARMSLIEHIRELRNRILKALIALTLGAIAGWYIEPHIWKFVTAPYCRLPARYIDLHDIGGGHGKGGCNLVVTGVFDYFFLHLKLAIAIGIVFSAPIWLYQLWAFIAPGLHARERRWAYFFAGAALPLFAMGGALAYFAMSKGLGFLLHMLPSNVIPLITVTNYLSFAIAMLLIFGLSFELPLVMVLLNVAGVLTHQRFAKWRRMIIFLVFAFAAVATPSPDPISMLLLAVPCVALVEAAELFAWVNDRRRARRGTVYPGLSPEEIHEYGLDTEPAGVADLDDIEASR